LLPVAKIPTKDWIYGNKWYNNNIKIYLDKLEWFKWSVQYVKTIW
jgi:hypothetical protein